jgi:exonuclease SbcC
MNRSRDRFDELTRSRGRLELAVAKERARLEAEIAGLERQVEEQLRPRVGAGPAVGASLEKERARLDALAQEERALVDGRGQLVHLAAQTGQLEAGTARLKTEGQELRAKLEMIRSSHQEARCPLCDTELGSEGCTRLSHGYTLQIEEKRRLYQENEGRLKASKKERAVLEAELPRRDAGLRKAQREAQEAVALLENQLRESQEAARQLEAAGRQLAGERERLKEGLFAPEERRQLAQLDGEIGALGYDRPAHDQLYKEMQGLVRFQELRRRLQEAASSLPREQESLARAQALHESRDQELQAIGKALQEKGDELGELDAWEGKLRSAQESHQALEKENNQLLRKQGELEGHVKRLQALEREMDGKERLLGVLREEESIYRELADAFGKRGVQAMLIEAVLPRVEQEANAILGRMTDNRMHVKLETQQQRRSGRGEPMETLEIKISDEIGPRSYELFSGGEAFRINLALRIALSKVLAHRKGAPLPTLFIDEGFGTQDASGRERILDVISAIEEDFEKIIVVTHLEELKEAFQARIEVQKEETGSTFWVSY